MGLRNNQNSSSFRFLFVFFERGIERTLVNGGNGLIQLPRSFEMSTVSLSPLAQCLTEFNPQSPFSVVSAQQATGAWPKRDIARFE